MAPTKLPVTTGVFIEMCAKPSNTTSYILFLPFLQLNTLLSLSYNRDEALPLPYMQLYPLC